MIPRDPQDPTVTVGDRRFVKHGTAWYRTGFGTWRDSSRLYSLAAAYWPFLERILQFEAEIAAKGGAV